MDSVFTLVVYMSCFPDGGFIQKKIERKNDLSVGFVLKMGCMREAFGDWRQDISGV